MPRGSRRGAFAALVLAPSLLITACGSPTATPSDPPSAAGPSSTSGPSSDPLCENFAGIYASWASAWKRDVDRSLSGGLDLAKAQERASRTLTEPFRRAVLAEIDRDAENAEDQVLISAMSALYAAPDDQSGFERLATVCGAVGPIPVAR